MRYFSVECEAPGSFGPRAILRYDADNTVVTDVEYFDLEFEVWLGGELVEQIGFFGVSDQLWEHLVGHGTRGVSVRPMSVTVGKNVHRMVPPFKELVLVRTARAEEIDDEWMLEAASVPDCDMFTGYATPLFVSEKGKQALAQYPRAGVRFTKVRIRD